MLGIEAGFRRMAGHWDWREMGQAAGILLAAHHPSGASKIAAIMLGRATDLATYSGHSSIRFNRYLYCN